MKHVLTVILCCFSLCIFSQKTIDFPSQDGLVITADIYDQTNNDSKLIILFHQAGWSRGEYKEIAPKLVKMGYRCMAVDLRSGGAVNDVKNKTHTRAIKQGKKTKYVDAFQDIEASVEYAKAKYNPEKIIIWGSSYSSSLVLKYAGDHPDKMHGVLSFSPGEYFGEKNFVAKSATHIKVPVFITSAQNEKKSWSGIYEAISSENKQFFLPETKGNHGSRALWEKFSDHKSYWKAVKKFLETI